ncbi:putative pyruvate dehydrogenase complex component Pdx1 [Aspergillus melleus]|uniref:putative pyruvate dehydrogenase complex component Pdx1 n=1 Tax=Aspergillus melleus TaxID=138277 RepID=UPI001E8CEAB8|nr:pyridoxine biosynthesis protein [Aspergillus melleus]KAH8426754.1 pyridoxine biosynthesis protein [Aspergillus melleus]
MAASLRQVPAVLARRQPRVIGTTRRLASSSSIQTQNPAYPLYPSVIQLLHEKGIPESDISKIPASGPKGRLLKGDVLAYLGAIASDYPAIQAARIAQLAHLDLSNIKIVGPEPKAAAPVVEEAPVAKPPPTTSVAVSISLAAVLSAQKKLQDSLGVSVPLSTFLARAADLANDDLPRSPRATPSADELFNEVLGGEPVTTSRGDFVPELNAVAAPVETRSVKPVQEDIIDILSGKASKVAAAGRRASRAESAPAEQAANVFSLTIPVGEEKRAQTFLDRVKTLLTVEPGRLVL